MQRERLTVDRIRRFECPDEGRQSFLWDTVAPRLAVRATAGAKSFIFEAKLTRQTIRRTIGDVRAWSLDDARAEANRLQVLIDSGIDPREQDREREAERAAAKARAARARITFKEAWLAYVEERGPRWGDRYRDDHLYAIAGKKSPQPLAKLVDLRLAEFTEKRVLAWLDDEAKKRPTQAACAFRKLRAFAGWCTESDAYAGLIDPAVFRQKRIVEAVPPSRAKDDCLQREQLRPWFEHVRRLYSPGQSAYLQILLLTGARRGELAGARWEDVDFKWKTMRLRDKIDGERLIPLTPYVAKLLRDLKSQNETPPPPRIKRRGQRVEDSEMAWEPSPWVFSGRGASGRIERPNTAHCQALAAAGLPHITLHGLRRSFGTLAEWCEVPVGVVAQIQGHKPSALAEKHYRRRPIDLLRQWHAKVESWILTEAEVARPGEHATVPALRTISGGGN